MENTKITIFCSDFMDQNDELASMTTHYASVVFAVSQSPAPLTPAVSRFDGGIDAPFTRLSIDSIGSLTLTAYTVSPYAIAESPSFQEAHIKSGNIAEHIATDTNTSGSPLKRIKKKAVKRSSI